MIGVVEVFTLLMLLAFIALSVLLFLSFWVLFTLLLLFVLPVLLVLALSVVFAGRQNFVSACHFPHGVTCLPIQKSRCSYNNQHVERYYPICAKTFATFTISQSLT